MIRTLKTTVVQSFVALALLAAWPQNAHAQFTSLYNFTNGLDGESPHGGLILDSTGTILYGTTQSGGDNGFGTVFSYDLTTNNLTILYSFTGASDGSDPFAGLVLDPTGTILYGTTDLGGTDGAGTVFAVNTDGSTAAPLTPLYTFTGGSDGSNAYAGVILDPTGSILYGTTLNGGSAGKGTVFAVNTDGSTAAPLTPLYTFTGGRDGASPQAGLILSGDALTLYGEASIGGASHYGTVFAVQTDGSTVAPLTPLYSFTGGSDGSAPAGGLIFSGDGTMLYGTTLGSASPFGGTGFGTVFAVKTNGSTAAPLTPIYTFTGTNDGSAPAAGVVLSDNGQTLYGTAFQGGSHFSGTIFAVQTDGSSVAPFTTLYNFTDGSDGKYPESPLVLSQGMLFGTAVEGGASGFGTLFDIAVSPRLTPSFSGLTANQSTAVGTTAVPISGTVGVPGVVYALLGEPVTVTIAGNAQTTQIYDHSGDFSLNYNASFLPESGTPYTVTYSYAGDAFLNSASTNTTLTVSPCGVNTTLYTLPSSQYFDTAGVTLSGSTLYEVEGNGGSSGVGGLYSFNLETAEITNFYSFPLLPNPSAMSPYWDGASPVSAPIVSGTTLYGTTEYGGIFWGTLYSFDTANPGAGITILHRFADFPTDGAVPRCQLLLSGNTLYGTAIDGGTVADPQGYSYNYGTLYSYNLATSVYTSYDFPGGSGLSGPGAGSLVLSSDGKTLYGTAGGSGTFGNGGIYSFDIASGTFTTLYNFHGYNNGIANCEGIVLSGDGRTLYGAGFYNGLTNYGVVFAAQTDGSTVWPPAPLYSFAGYQDDYSGAYGPVLLSGNILYGTTEVGGSAGLGTVYALNTDGTGFTTLHNFTGDCDGAYPAGPTALSGDGTMLYGTDEGGGVTGGGTLFAVPLPARGGTRFSNLAASETIPSCQAYLSLTGTVSGPNGLFPSPNEKIAITIGGNTQTTNIYDNTGNFSLYFNLSGLSPGTYNVTYSYPGDAVLNPTTTNGTTLAVVVTTPVAGTSVLAATENQSFSVPVSTVLQGDSATLEVPLSITAVTSPTAGGATVTLASGDITYGPAAGFTGSDTIQYTLSDGCATVPGTIAVTVGASGSPQTAMATVPAGQTATVTVPPTGGQGGVAATLNNVSGSQSATVTAKLYSSNPIGGSPGFGLGTTYLDLAVSGASSSDTLTANFYYPNNAPAPILMYYNGNSWQNVVSDLPPPEAPVASLQNGLWQYTVIFDSASTPAITALTGTVFALATGVAPALAVTHSGNGIKISWPATGSYILQQNTTLSANNWTTSGYTVSTSNGANSITLTPSTGALFFRLANP